MRDRIDIVSAERVRDELTKLLLSDRPRAGLEALVESGLADIVFPEIPALQLQIDEHHRHKDVFEHTMIVLERAIALETGPDGPGARPRPDAALGRRDARYRQAEDPPVRAGRQSELPPP